MGRLLVGPCSPGDRKGVTGGKGRGESIRVLQTTKISQLPGKKAKKGRGGLPDVQRKTLRKPTTVI